MGKKRHSKDRMFITAAEHKYEWGGKKDQLNVPIAKLPFNCCSLSLLPFEDPVCTKEGIVFDIVNIIPFIKKYKRNPVTWVPLKASDLIKLNFHKNEKGEYWDPVASKIFTDYTHLVAIATSGNVYCYETIEELNRKPKFWKDLMTDEDFTVKDIIVLQDPKNLQNRTVQNFQYIKEDIDIAKLKEEMGQSTDKKQNIVQNSTGKKILDELEKKYKEEEETKAKEPDLKKLVKKDPKEVAKESDQYAPEKFIAEVLASGKNQHDRFTSGEVAASFTSTSLDLANDNKTRQKTPDEVRQIYYQEVKQTQSKAYVMILTNYGGLNVMLHCDFAPKTCENFIELCERKYYNGTTFHRLVKNFVVQGGDPTGTGKGGQSVFGFSFKDEFHPKLSNNKAGIMSMANSGPNTNNSQFLASFFTLKPQTYLDGKHAVFGEVVSGLQILDELNKISVDANERPTSKIEIQETVVFNNPFRDAIKAIKEKEKKKTDKLEKQTDSGERWLAPK